MVKTLVWRGVELWLFASKALYIPDHKLIVLSDWHLGKLGHFRKEGLFIPPMKIQEELDRLGDLLQKYRVEKVVFLGDLFHSSWNYEWNEFLLYISKYSKIDFLLTRGNHDLFAEDDFFGRSMTIVDHIFLGNHCVLSHLPIQGLPSDILNIVGHLHPGVEVLSKGRQRFKLPCFLLQNNILTLPAFGKWTGLYLIKNAGDNRIFAIVGNEVMELE